MIKSVTVQNPFVGDDPLVLNLPSSHEEHGIYIKSITGIGPDKATINTTSLAMEDGGIFNSAKSDIRNIVITLGFYESSILHNSIEDSRHLTYKYFPKKKEITLIFETDNRTLAISGYVESNEPDIFNKEETTQISIICTDPNFYDIDDMTYTFGSANGLFEFPFENNTVNDDELTSIGGMSSDEYNIVNILPIEGVDNTFYYVKKNLGDDIVYDEYYYLEGGPFIPLQENKVLHNAKLCMGDISEAGVYEVYYNGDADIGIIMTIHLLGEVGNITINNVIPDDILELDVTKIKELAGIEEFQSGDNIVVISKVGHKSIFFERDDIKVDVLNAMNKEYFDRSWFTLTKGLNQFTFNAETGRDNVKIIIDANVAYDGV